MFTTTYLVTDFINEFFVIAVVVTVIFNSSFQGQKDWLNLINRFQYLDKIFNNYYEMLKYWINEISYGYDNIVHFLIFNIAIALKCRYENLNKLLNIDVVVGYRTKKESIHFIRKIGSISRILAETIDSFNRIFGWPLMFLIGKTVVQLLICLSNVLINDSMKDDVFMKKLTMSNVVFSVYTMTSIAIVILSCDYVGSESDRSIFLCYKLQEQFPYDSRERMELFNLAKQITANATKITAANFFEVNKNTLFGIFGTTATYSIILLQFQGSSCS
ncbi:7tm 7 domain containing protein [Asbolus verrucosus]|uniref:7tm 7 domain containing protein n=1 Tax=Asbolus verrucosus TaxID=1661398 RepID=A0A482W2M4_ASBVE|nr:7tm 7 domain containing protein [Asbolus verrucosus]